MIFAQKSIQDILSGKKQQTRRLVKKGEGICLADGLRSVVKDSIAELVDMGCTGDIRKKSIKWQVGSTYAVQNGRGTPCVWYCPKCKELYYKDDEWFGLLENLRTKETTLHNCVNEKCFWGTGTFKPLRIRLTEITMEKLCDITESDALQEGFVRGKPDKYWFIDRPAKINFLIKFVQINHSKVPFAIIKEELCEEGGYSKWWEDTADCETIAEAWNPDIWCLTFQKVD